MTRFRLLFASLLVVVAIGDRPRALNASSSSATPPIAISADDNNAIPVALDAFTFGGNSGRYRITNGSKVPLVAYTVMGGKPSGQPWTHVDDLRMSGDPLSFGQNHLGDEIWNMYEYPRGLHVTMALFADGTSKGDHHYVDSVMTGRREVLHTYVSTSRAICDLVRQHQSVAAIYAALEAKKADYVHTSDDRYANRVTQDAYKSVTESMGKNQKDGPVAAARITLKMERDVSQRLVIDPVKDASGKLYIQDPTIPAVCPLQ